MIYLYFKTNGEVEKIESEETLSLDRLQELVGGMIEFAPLEKDGTQPVVNEDGLGLMLPKNPFFKPEHQPYYVGNILLGKDVEGNFLGFTDEVEVEQYMRKVIAYDQSIFKKDAVFTIIGIGDFMGQTTKSEIKATGEIYNNKPAFKENVKGARKKFSLRNLEDEETMLFSGSVPFKVDAEVSNAPDKLGFTSTTMRGNALYNLHGDPEVIKDWVKNKNLNPFFRAYDKVNHIGENGVETLLFTDTPTLSQSVIDRRIGQEKRK